ncbi:enterochelin esterase domain-containing protein [Pseudomonas aeruginosa]
MSAVSTSLLLFLNLLTPAQAAQPVPLADGRIEIAAGESRQRYLDLAPGELQLLDLEVDRGRVRLRATTPDGKALRATELAGRQSLGLQAGERQGLRLTFSADEDTALTLIPIQRLTPQTPALDSPAPQSPTLQRLQAELAEKRPGALKAFWKQVAKQGTPLVEPLDAERVLVTFLWRQQRPGDVRLLWPTPEVNTRRFEALAGSDVRYLSLPLRRDARVSYQLSADLPDLQQADRGTLRLALQAAARPDPLSRTPWLNSRALPRAEQASLVQLGGAPAETWDQPRKDVPRGKVERLGYTSQALANQRQLTLYTPPGYDPEGQRYPLLVLFDEDHYARDVPTPTILDNLIAAGRIRPTLAVIVGNVDASSRGRELPCNEAFADMLAHELLPWLQQRLCIERGACRSRAFRFQLRRAGLGLHRLPLPGTLRQGAEPVRLVLVGAGRAAAAVAGTAVRRWRAFAAGVLPQFRPARGARGGRHSRQQPQPARGAARQGLPAALP